MDAAELGLGSYADWERLADEQLAAGHVFKGLLPRGATTLFSAEAMAGKTAIVSQLAGDAVNGRPFLGFECKEPAAVIWFNSDRTPEKNMVGRLRRTCRSEEELHNLRRLFRPVLREFIPKRVDVDYIRRCTETLRSEARHDGPIIVVLDSLRSCFLQGMPKGAENDSPLIAEALCPIRDLATADDLSPIVLHHNSRGSGTYAGSGMIKGASDATWSLSRKSGADKSYLDFDSREDDAEPYRLEITNTFDGFIGRRVPLKGMSAASDSLFALLPADDEEGWEVAQLCLAANIEDAEARRRLSKGEKAGLVGRVKRGGRVVFFRLVSS
ncbi:AAA family ATPase [Caulifigura coniformis]|uniref:AAA family ATPase n=1 Tax=Caulifigura coniformis TaxID=2527983 RepID=UPI0018D20538|nr:AAA family ATPase [Caulifigura coniformis]